MSDEVGARLCDTSKPCRDWEYSIFEGARYTRCKLLTLWLMLVQSIRPETEM